MSSRREKMNKKLNKHIAVNEKERSVFGMMQELPMGVVEETSYKASALTTEVLKVIDFIKNVDIENSTNPLFSTTIKCSKTDLFNERIGKDIVGSIVDRKYHDSMARRYWRMCDYLIDIANEVTELAEYHSDKAQKIDDDLERVYKQVKE